MRKDEDEFEVKTYTSISVLIKNAVAYKMQGTEKGTRMVID